MGIILSFLNEIYVTNQYQRPGIPVQLCQSYHCYKGPHCSYWYPLIDIIGTSNGLYSYQLDYPQSFAYQGEGHIFRSQWTDLFQLIPAVSNTFGQQLNYLKDGYASGKNWKKETNLGVV